MTDKAPTGQDKYPLRAVVSRAYEQQTGTTETLECGHIYRAHWSGRSTPKRRHCYPCFREEFERLNPVDPPR